MILSHSIRDPTTVLYINVSVPMNGRLYNQLFVNVTPTTTFGLPKPFYRSVQRFVIVLKWYMLLHILT